MLFNKSWFLKIFNEYPLLLEFITPEIQISSDSTNLKELNEWQSALYSALEEKLGGSVQRALELERTLLSIMFLYAIQSECIDQGGLEFIKKYGSNLDKEDIDKLRQLGVHIDFNQVECQLFILATIFGDIGKIDKIRNDFTKHYGLVSQDQDIAQDYILGLDKEILKKYFKLTDNQVSYLQSHRFPLHLGHAAQAECTAKKFSEAKTFLMQFDDKSARESLINYAILKQMIDVAGARGQNGVILLNKIILNIYLRLKDVLLFLAQNDSEPGQIYWKYVYELLQVKENTFSDQTLQLNSISQGIDSYEKQGLIYRLILQLRLNQQSQENKKNQDMLLVEKIITKLLSNNASFRKDIEYINLYDLKAPHIFTYGPAIFATLKSKAEQNPSLMQNIADSSIEFAIIVGIKLQALACQQYMNLAEHAPFLKESPLNFNPLNAALLNNPQLALDIFNGKCLLRVSANARVLVGQGKSYDISNFEEDIILALKSNNYNQANKIYIHYLKTQGDFFQKDSHPTSEIVSFSELQSLACLKA